MKCVSTVEQKQQKTKARTTETKQHFAQVMAGKRELRREDKTELENLRHFC